MPYDCKCKSYLNPIVPTFDVLPGHSHGSITSLPYIATMSDDAIFYRTPGRVKGRSAWELKRYVLDHEVPYCLALLCISFCFINLFFDDTVSGDPDPYDIMGYVLHHTKQLMVILW